MIRSMFTCLLVAGMANLSLAQGLGGDVLSGVASVNPGRTQSGSTGTGGTQGQGIGESSVAQGLTGNRGATIQDVGFLQSSNQETGFLGGGGADAQGQNFGAGRGNQFGNAGGFFGGGGQFGGGGRAGQNRQRQQQQPTRVIRTRLTIPRDFAVTMVPVKQVSSRLTSQFQRINRMRPVDESREISLQRSRITTTITGRTAVLRGQVANDRDRRLAEQMAKMEPGVDAVVNNLTTTTVSP